MLFYFLPPVSALAQGATASPATTTDNMYRIKEYLETRLASAQRIAPYSVLHPEKFYARAIAMVSVMVTSGESWLKFFSFI